MSSPGTGFSPKLQVRVSARISTENFQNPTILMLIVKAYQLSIVISAVLSIFFTSMGYVIISQRPSWLSFSK
jgi:hypothetical protein